MRARGLFMLLAAFAAAPAVAQPAMTSAAPDHVAVTIYRNPDRSLGEQPSLRWLNGYALISETRRVTLPAGESELRFEGVAGGIVPQSAIVTGLPEGVIERNRDAYLLSPSTLADRSLGRRVHLRRTSAATGAVTEGDAVIRSSAQGLVLQTPAGIEALRCTGLAETVTYDGVPPGLSARPTLSVSAHSAAPVTATVTLSYLASGFDWQANYIAELDPDGQHVALFAWLTLASMDETSFVGADTQAVAGRVNREAVEEQPREGGPVELQCWPQATTSDIPLAQLQRQPAAMRGMMGGEDVVVTGVRARFANMAATAPVTVVMAQQEALGDLKLYRIPEPVTVAANSQKQVALLQQPRVAVRHVYRLAFGASQVSALRPADHLLLTHNRASDGLGLPLPGGNLSLFGSREGRRILIGQGTVGDHAVNEDVEIDLNQAPGVQASLSRPEKNGDYVLTVSNDQPAPIAFEADLNVPDDMRFRPSGHVGRRNGRPLWAVTVPANGRAILRYRLPRQ